MNYITAGDVCELTGLSPKTLDNWCRWGVLSPANNGSGRGVHRLFNVLDCVALANARTCAFVGMKPEIVKRVLSFLTELGEDGLAAEFAKGHHILMVDPDGTVRLADLLNPDDYFEKMLWVFDVRSVYRRMSERVAELSERSRPNGRRGAISN